MLSLVYSHNDKQNSKIQTRISREKKLVFTPTLHQHSTCLMQFYGTRSCFQINILLFYRPIQGH